MPISGQSCRAFVSGCAGLSLTPEERRLFESSAPWGLILFKRNIDTRDQVRALTREFRALVGRDDAPVLIDQEGGRVQRLGPPHWRRYPAALAGALYPDGIPIFEERELAALVARLRVRQVVFAYSDVPHSDVMHIASRVLATGADFIVDASLVSRVHCRFTASDDGGLEVRDLDGFYKASRAKFEASDDFKERARERVVKLQSRTDTETTALWQALVGQSTKHFNEVYAKLGILLTDHDLAGESKYNDLLAPVVERLRGAGLLVESDGAEVVFHGRHVGAVDVLGERHRERLVVACTHAQAPVDAPQHCDDQRRAAATLRP